MEFLVTAKTSDGKEFKDTVTGKNEKEVLEELKKQGLFVLNISSDAKKSAFHLNIKRKVSLKDKIIFTKQLAMMTKGGLPLVEALKALEEQNENQIFKSAIKQIMDDVRGGLALSKAIEKHPKIFPTLYVAVVASGEKSGKMDEVLERLAEQLQKDYDLISKVKTAISYPIVIVCALLGVVAMMLIFVIPKLKQIFTEMGVELPVMTRVLLGISDFSVKCFCGN